MWVIGEGKTEEFRVDAKTVVPIEASDKTLPEISWKSLGAWKVKITYQHKDTSIIYNQKF